MSREMPLTNSFARKPCTVLISAFMFLLVILGIVIYFEMYIIQPFNVRDYLVWSDPKCWDFDKMSLVKQELLQGSSDGRVNLQTQIDPYWVTFMIYGNNHPTEPSLWNKENLIAIRDLENKTRIDPVFNSTCYLQEVLEYDENGNEMPTKIDEYGEVNAVCHPEASFFSVTDVFKIVTNMTLDRMEELREEEIQAILVGAIETDLLWRNIKTLFDKNVSLKNPNVKNMRSQILLAGPLRTVRSNTTNPDGSSKIQYLRYNDINDDRVAQENIIQEF